jgi:hypothetical protein
MLSPHHLDKLNKMKNKTKLILLLVMIVILFIDYYVILPKFLFLMGWFVLGAFAFCGPIIAMFFLIRSFFIKDKTTI